MTPYSTLPYSHNGLKAFESVARLMSFTHAAHELHVTQSAVSRQVKQLEDDLGASLIIRKHRAIELTSQGVELSLALRKNYAELESIISSWQEPKQKRIVIKATLSFTTRVLIPKVRELNERYPDHEIVIIPSLEEDECLDNPDYDLLIFHTRRKDHYDNKANMFLLREEFMAPVCATSIATEETDLDSILTMPRLHPTLDHHDWKMWLSVANNQTIHDVRNTSFLSLDLALTACLSGQGVTVTDLLLIIQELEKGFFYCPKNAKIQHSAWTYYGHQRTHNPIIDDLILWLISDSKKEIKRLKALATQYGWHGVI
ncbi:LysR family transcriptional regulator [Aliivibrio finisterrensis]|uniref:LysR family transcriptional regulator n=1 Tax=Aliivibrio finisterrensis TaxID=511998 RepID=UPI00101F7952|nr:LysR family transcriptional regulator [Aliivibrio finisterrensis]RYU68689.1 LysR family transcriptional regulator [Aliivibrio finisterrensis]RYU72905.1 LysR family transcriptional regulator [Aliivibrio finisterrensis]RYU75231.1 LysR family transcriptional regulator [Aliivibrio finisterrensis]